jgi:TonB family protein
MNDETHNSGRSDRRREAVVAVLVSVVIHVLIAVLAVWWFQTRDVEEDTAQPEKREEQQEQVAEVLFEEFDTSEEESEPSEESPETSEQDPEESVQASQPEEAPEPEPESQPEPEEEQQPEPEQPEPQPTPPQQNRQSVDQPTSNEEVPESEDFYWSQVDNRAEQQTRAEESVQWTEDSAPVTEQSSESEETESRGQPSESEAQTQSEQQESSQEQEEGRDERTEQRQGTQDPQQAQASEAGASPAETEETTEARDEQLEGQQVPESEQGEVEAGESGTRSLEELSVQRRTREAFESGVGQAESGQGSGSVTRQGAVAAEQSVTELFGEEIAEGRENLQEQRRRESLSGDHQANWERTREALANYDIAVETGSETHLNTRRNEHASFIHGYHNQLHQRWWDFLGMLNASYSPSHPVSDLELLTRIEIRVMADGTVEDVNIIRGSGNTYFDAEAIRIQFDIGEVPPPSNAIVCDDNSVYLHWTLSRTPGRCGTHRASVHCPSGK